MQSMVYFPHPSWPASIGTSGQGKRNIESLVSYQVFCWYGVVSMHPKWSGCSASWSQYRTSAAVLLPDQDYCTSPWTVWTLDITDIQYLLDMGVHIIVYVGRYMSVMLLEGCLIHYLYFVFGQSSFTEVQITVCKQVLPFEQQLSGLLLLWFGSFFETLEAQGLQDPSLLGFLAWLFRSPGWMDNWWYLVGRDNLPNHSLCRNFHSTGTQVVQRDRYPGGPQM